MVTTHIMRILIRFFREPLIRFLMLGALLFGFFQAVSPQQDDAPPDRVIRITQTDLDRISARFEAVWTRAPNAQELEKLIDAHVREEVFVREAIALSLDRDDTIIRQRLYQKMEFLLQSIADLKQPTEDELRHQFEQDIGTYSEAPRYSFHQVFLGGSETAKEDIANLLQQLRLGADHTQTGQTSMLPMTMRLTPSRDIDARFGKGFAQNLGGMTVGEWVGPVSSGFGQHLIKVVVIQQPAAPVFSEIREKVEVSWRRTYLEKMTTEQFEALAANYRIVRDDTGDAQ